MKFKKEIIKHSRVEPINDALGPFKEIRVFEFGLGSYETIINVSNDIHIGSAFNKGRFDQWKDVIGKRDNYFLIGDIFDFSGVSKDNYLDMQIDYRLCRITHGQNYIMGNHERNKHLIYNQEIIFDEVSLFHGHFEYWGEKKAVEYIKKDHCSGEMKRLAQMSYQKLRGVFGPRFKSEQIDRLNETLERHVTLYAITGHKHPRHMIALTFSDKTVFVMPRGHNKLILRRA